MTQPVAQGSRAPLSRQTGAAWAIALASVAITLGGLGIIFSHAWDLVGPYHPGPRAGDATMVAMTMIVCGTATIFGIMGLFMRLFLRLLSGTSEAAQPVKAMKPVVTGSHPHAQMPAPPVPIASVTEHTTRNFVPRAYEEANRRE
jgi:hypothetical protein